MNEAQMKKNESSTGKMIQLCGFKVGEESYAVPVIEVQEVIKPQLVTPVPLAPKYVRGLINLRGQIVTAISLRTLFGLEDDLERDYMNIIVKSGDSLYSLVVDQILDVLDVKVSSLEKTPDTVDQGVRDYIKEVYKLDRSLLISLNLDKVLGVDTNQGNE